jgi:hypothetical protein
MYDNDADSITRPDIPAALVPSEEDARASGFHPRAERELAPYTAVPVLTARLNEPTIPDAALRVSMAQSARVEEHTPSAPSAPSVPPRSGTRQQLASTVPPPAMASTVPPPPRARTKQAAVPDRPPSSDRRGERLATPLPTLSAPASDRRGERLATPLPTLTPTHTVTPAPAPAPVSHFHMYLLIAGTAVAAAAIGIGLGNGSLGRFGERLHARFVELDLPPAPLATSKAAPVRPSATPSATSVTPAQAPPRASALEDAPKVPVMRIDQLPATEQASVAENEPKVQEPKRREPKRPRRVPGH